MKNDHKENQGRGGGQHHDGDGHGHGDAHEHGHDPRSEPNRPELFVDNDRYDWNSKKITGKQLRALASLPEDVQIFHKIPGRPDEEIKDDTAVDLTKQPGPDRFWTQPVGSQAG